MTLKRIVLLLLTIVALIPILSSLLGSINQPQVQSNLQLYQTNLLLQASEIKLETFEDYLQTSPSNFQIFRVSLLGNDPYLTAQNQYVAAGKLTEDNISNLTRQLQSPLDDFTDSNLLSRDSQESLKQKIQEQQNFLNQINLNLGIIQAQKGESIQAIKTWSKLANKSTVVSDEIALTAEVLMRMWREPIELLPQTYSTLNQNLHGWFLDSSLKRFFQLKNDPVSLSKLDEKQQNSAIKAILKLTIIGILPIISGTAGVGILIVLGVQLLLKKKNAILAYTDDLAWDTPWNVETIWQVLIVGFLFLGQVVLPLLFGLIFNVLNLNDVELSLRAKAVYVLVSYLTMTCGGILVLYLSLKPFFPLPKDWFRFEFFGNWFFWGVGGYLVALPLVVVVSLINQQIWHGQGGSNPLLTLALEAQDQVALVIFFFTAAVAAPLFEEIIFRGFLLPSLTRYLPVSGAIGISSLVFALAHLNLSEVLPLATLGVILGGVYTRSRNLLSPMLLHSLWNSGTLLSLFILGSSNY